MKNNIKLLLSFLSVFIIFTSCGEDQKESSAPITVVQQPINPNGDTELALLMRAMFEEAQTIKTQIDQGEPITVTLNHEDILTAEATEPEKAASAAYKAFADTYLQSIKNLQTAAPNEKLGAYENMVVNCMACHTAICPGPMVKIKKLQ